MEAITEIIAGLFALLAVYLAWRLGDNSSKQSIARERWKEKADLYSNIYSTFEQAISEIAGHKQKSSLANFPTINARVALLAIEDIAQKYFVCCDRLEEWAATYAKAYPNNGIVQAPDPTAKYKQPAQNQYEALQTSLRELAEAMKKDLS